MSVVCACDLLLQFVNAGVMDTRDVGQQSLGQSHGTLFVHGIVLNGPQIASPATTARNDTQLCGTLSSSTPDTRYVPDSTCNSGEIQRWAGHGCEPSTTIPSLQCRVCYTNSTAAMAAEGALLHAR